MWGNNDYKKERKMSEERNSKEFNFDTFFLNKKLLKISNVTSWKRCPKKVAVRLLRLKNVSFQDHFSLRTT